MSAANHGKPNRTLTGTKAIVRRRLLAVAVAAVTFVVCATTDSAQNTKPTQYDVEAAYLFNFAKFVRWPQYPGARQSTLAICIVADDAFSAVLDRTVSGEKIDGKPVVEKRIASPQEVSACSILYIGASEFGRAVRILAEASSLPVLTVSDMPGFLDRGGMIQFVLLDDRVRFKVNLQPTQHDGLTLSSELLKVALEVRGANAAH